MMSSNPSSTSRLDELRASLAAHQKRSVQINDRLQKVVIVYLYTVLFPAWPSEALRLCMYH